MFLLPTFPQKKMDPSPINLCATLQLGTWANAISVSPAHRFWIRKCQQLRFRVLFFSFLLFPYSRGHEDLTYHSGTETDKPAVLRRKASSLQVGAEGMPPDCLQEVL